VTRKREIQSYKDLITWQVADELAWFCYQLTDLFPKHELYGMSSQLRRAAISVPLNVVEGYARLSKREFRRFLVISLGSLAEVGYLLEFSQRRKYITRKDYERAMDIKDRCGQLLWKLMKSQE
jgi:four helix bundle protein